MIEIKNLSAGYGEVQIVKDISFTAENNENYCLIGPNGCGKTTLLNAIAGIISYKGDVLVDGINTKDMKHSEMSKKIALMGQNASVYFSYSVFDTVMMGRYLHMKNGLFKSPTKKDEKFVLDCLKTVDLLSVKDKAITKISGGQLQRVYLARTLAQEPEIILLDEPTNHLDLKFQIELIEYLKEWSKEDSHSVIGVLHDINLALKLTDNILIMKEGMAVSQGKADNIITKEKLKEVYGVDVVGYYQDALTRWENK